MNNFDSLIDDIQDKEALKIDGSISTEAQKRIKAKIFDTITAENSLCIKPRRRSRRIPLVLAAALILTLGLTVAAKQNEWDITLLTFMGISNPDTLQLESGEVQINQSVQSIITDYAVKKTAPQEKVTMTAVSSIGDKNTAYIRIETDYILPDDFNPETDYILPENHFIDVSPSHGYGALFTYFSEDNRLGFLMEISNCKNLNKAKVSLNIDNLLWYHDLNNAENAPEELLLCEGTWNLEWEFRYKSNTETHHMFKPIEYNDCTYYLTKVELSPISIRMEAFRSRKDRDLPFAENWLEEIHFSDGTSRRIDNISGAGFHNGIYADSYIGLDILEETLIPQNIEKLIIMGEEIELR